jgi:DNA polymerase III alpha subunit (gram-positive type)
VRARPIFTNFSLYFKNTNLYIVSCFSSLNFLNFFSTKSKVVTPSKEEREKRGAQIREYILEDNDCPLAILMKHPSTGGSIIFQIRRCTPDILDVRKQKRKAAELDKLKQLHQEQQQQQQMHQQQQQEQQKIIQLQQNIHQQTLHQQQMNNNKPAATSAMMSASSSALQPSRSVVINNNTNNANIVSMKNNLPTKSNSNLYQLDAMDSTSSNVNNNINPSNVNATSNNEFLSNGKLPFPLLVELNHGNLII